MNNLKKIGLPMKGGRFINCQRDWSRLVEKEANTGAYEVLTQIATFAGIELGARVIEVMVFDKSAKARIEKVI